MRKGTVTECHSSNGEQLASGLPPDSCPAGCYVKPALDVTSSSAAAAYITGERESHSLNNLAHVRSVLCASASRVVLAVATSLA